MPEQTDSTLSLTYDELMEAVSYYLYGKAVASLTESQEDRCDEVVNAGYRQFLYPPASEGVPTGYEWSFLHPTTTITTELEDEEDEDSLYAADQDLPFDFGRLIDGFTFAANEQVPPVLADVGEGRIRRLRLQYDETGRPRAAGIRIKAGDGTTGQKREVLWYPRPDDEYVLSYKYEALVDKLTSELPYPLGAMKHAETLRLSCLAMADSMVNDKYGTHWEGFIRALASSVARDGREGQKYFGRLGGNDSDDWPDLFNATITINGVEV